MSFQMTVSRTNQAGGKNFPFNATINADNLSMSEVSVPAAKTGQLTTRTDDTNGVITMAAGHGFTTSDIIDVFWTVGGVPGQRRGVSTTVSTNAVTITGGAGDNLPVNLSNVTAMKPNVEALVISGDNIQAFSMFAEVVGAVQFVASGGTLVFGTAVGDVVGGAQSFSWTNVDKTANPCAGGSIATVRMSHGDATAARTVRYGVLHN